MMTHEGSWKSWDKPMLICDIEDAREFIKLNNLKNFLAWYERGDEGYTFPIVVWNYKSIHCSHQPVKSMINSKGSHGTLLHFAKWFKL